MHHRFLLYQKLKQIRCPWNRVFLELTAKDADYLKRLAFITLPNKIDETMSPGGFALKQSDLCLIDCEVELTDKDVDVLKQSLSSYETYQEIIEKSGVIVKIGKEFTLKIMVKITSRC